MPDTRLLARTWPWLRDGTLPEPRERLPTFLALGQSAMDRVKSAGGPMEAPADFATAVLAFAHVYRASPAAVPEFFRLVYAQESTDDARQLCRHVSLHLFKYARENRELLCLDAALTLVNAALTGEVSGHDFLVMAGKLRFELSGEPADHDEVIRHARAALAATSEGAAELRQRLREVGTALTDKASRLGDSNALYEAVPVLRRALALTNPGEPARALALSDLTGALITSSEKPPDVAGLDEALANIRELLTTAEFAVARDSQRPIFARLLTERFARRRDLEVLDEAIEVYRELCASAEPGQAEHGRWCGELGRHLLYRQQMVNDLSALTEAAPLLRTAVREAGVDALDSDVLTSMATVVSLSDRHSANLTALDEAIDALAEAVEPGRRQERDPAVLGKLSLILLIKDEVSPDVRLVHRSEKYARRAVAGPKHRGESLGHLGAALIARYGHEGDPAVLDDAIDMCRLAVQTADRDQYTYVEVPSRLAHALWERYKLTRHRASLDEAIETLRALSEGELPAAARGAAVVDLAAMLRERVDRTREVADAEEARRMLAAEIVRSPQDQFVLRSALAAILLSLARLTGDDGTLAEAAAQLELIIQAPAVSPRLKHMSENNLANVLLSRRDPSLVDRAVELARASLADLPAGHPDREIPLMVLARALSASGERDLGEAEQVLRELMNNPALPALSRTYGAVAMGRLAESDGRPAEALDAFRTGIDLLPLMTSRAADRADQEWLLTPFHELSRHAAEVAVRHGDPEQAVELLERGRGVLAAQALQTRTERTDLALREPELAARVERIRVELDQSSTAADWQLDSGSVTTGPNADRRHRLAREWTEVLAEVRERPGFEDFLEPPRFDRLVRAADHGPVVVLNTGAERCDALLLTEGGVRVCPLPDLSTKDAEEQVEILLEEAGSGDAVAERVVTDTLDWLWQVVAGPVLEELGLTGPPGEVWPRIWWCPTGPLTFLPIHAAASGGDSVFDRAVSSYTPNLGALLRARPDPASRKALVVAVADLAGHAPLPGALREAALVRDLLPATVLTDESATLDRLRAELSGHNWMHFACHGSQDTDEPSSGRLFLADGEIRVTDIARLRLDDAQLAFLSACETAVGGARLPDEAIHLTGALHLAGFTQVIGTLWRVADEPALTIAEHVYRFLGTHDSAAHALHHAVRALRAEMPDRPSDWASHIHVGP